VLSTNLLYPITSGSLEVAKEDSTLVVRYELTFTELVVLCTLLASFLSIVIASASDIRRAVIISITAWSFVVGGNFAMARARFRSLVMRTIREVALQDRSPVNFPH
jgi:hypothetical protein